jgi:single-stranded DNA-binding protein
MDLNRICLTGRLDREPLLYDIGDHHVAALHLVSEHRWQQARGRRVDLPQSYHLTAWEELADRCGRLLHAGDRVYVSGHLRLYTSWVDGVEHSAHEVVLDQLLLLAADAPGPDQSRARRLMLARLCPVVIPFTSRDGPTAGTRVSRHSGGLEDLDDASQVRWGPII